MLDSGIVRYGGADADISLLPTTSGHRDPENQHLHFTTDYDKFYDFYDAIGDPGRMSLAIPLSEVLSARLFDMDLYEDLASTEGSSSGGVGGEPQAGLVGSG